MGPNTLSSRILIQKNFVTHGTFMQEYMKLQLGLSFYRLKRLFGDLTWFGYCQRICRRSTGSVGFHRVSVVRGSVSSLIVTTFGELIWTALQFETWCHHPINFLETVLGFDVCLSEKRLQSPLGVCEESFGSLIVTIFGELILKALQIETWCHHPINFLETVMGLDIRLSGDRWVSLRTLLVV